jgi:hypothetical protein
VNFRRWFIFVLLLASCRQEPHILPDRAFYFWKHEYTMSNFEDSTLTQHQINKIYIKLFDVSEGAGEAIPVADIAIDRGSVKSTIEYVPVVFLTQGSLLHTNDAGIHELAENIYSKVIRMSTKSGITFHEIQLDCDWATHTREKYFRLIEYIKELSRKEHVSVSCTIRLHDIKYKNESGIPPCDRGMLMFYNMGDWRKQETTNSIFDPRDAEGYLPYIKDYPMKLDVALPVFHWALAYRDNKFLAILGDADENSFAHNSAFEKNSNYYKVVRDTFAFAARLKAGDMIRTETSDAKTVAEFSHRIFNLLPDEHRTFALYHLDSAALTFYSHDDLENIFPH